MPSVVLTDSWKVIRITPCLANSSPETVASEPLPPTKPPPCIQTITGNWASCLLSDGCQMFRYRQSSDEPAIEPEPRGQPACAQFAPYLLASSTPSHIGAGWGGRQRNAPTGGAAYGMLKAGNIPIFCPTDGSRFCLNNGVCIRTSPICDLSLQGCTDNDCKDCCYFFHVNCFFLCLTNGKCIER